MAINLALLKHGYSNFQLEILEYCKKSELIKREQYYLDLLQPEYNILKIAGSSLGYKHTQYSKEKMSEAKLGSKHTLFGKTLSEETKAKMSAAKEGGKNHMLGKTRPEGAGSPCQKIEVFDTQNNLTTIYASVSEAARAISCARTTIQSSLIRPGAKPYKGRFVFRKKY